MSLKVPAQRALTTLILSGPEWPQIPLKLWSLRTSSVMVWSSSLSALQALMSDEPDTTQKKLTENINTLAQTTYVVLQWIPAHTGIRGNKMADQLAKEGREKSNPHRICHTEKSKLLSIIKRKPSSTARLKDTTQTRMRSISWRDTNRPSSFASEQATADWIAISRGLA